MHRIKNIVLLLFGLVFTFMILRLYQGRQYEIEAVDLDFPLKNGSYYISSGGSNKLINNHYGTSIISQQFAIDINKLGPYGRVSSKVFSGENEGHYIFGEAVFCPCEGKVVELVNDVNDNIGTDMNVSAENGQGNFVTIDCDNTVVSMVHLKKSSIKVQLGQHLKTGSLIGRIGNSGFSQEPHLHLQAARINKDSVLEGVPMNFKGQSPIRNNIVEN